MFMHDAICMHIRTLDCSACQKHTLQEGVLWAYRAA